MLTSEHLAYCIHCLALWLNLQISLYLVIDSFSFFFLIHSPPCSGKDL